MSEIDSPPVTDPETLVPTRVVGGSQLDRWLESDPERAVKLIETRVRLLETLRLASIRATYPSDWIIHTSLDSTGAIVSQRGYLQDIGAERAGKVWGIEVGSPAIEYKEFPDGTFGWWMIAEAFSKVTGERLDYVEGARWSGDRFFQRSTGPDEKVDPVDVRKSAWANLHGRAVRALSGLNGVPIEMLRQAGVDVAKVVMVTYDKGAKGGESTGASIGSVDVTVAFGRSAGKKVAELTDQDLGWYVKSYSENVADPQKEKYRKANQRVLDALVKEKDKRDQAAAHGEATGTPEPKPQNGKPAEGADKRGDLVNTVWALVQGVAGKKAMPLLHKIVAEQFGTKRSGVTDCTDEELAWVAQIPEANLKTVLATLDGKK